MDAHALRLSSPNPARPSKVIQNTVSSGMLFLTNAPEVISAFSELTGIGHFICAPLRAISAFYLILCALFLVFIFIFLFVLFLFKCLHF